MKINIVCGDITGFTGDVIVNAANPAMLGGGGVDGAIHRAAGPKLKALCANVADEDGVRCPVGTVRPTPAGDMAAKWVFHAVAPIFGHLRRSGPLRVGEFEERSPEVNRGLMEGLLKKIALIALGMDLTTIAIPALGCGIYGWSHEDVADIAMTWARKFESWPLDVTFFLYPSDAFPVWNTAAEKHGFEGV